MNCTSKREFPKQPGEKLTNNRKVLNYWHHSMVEKDFLTNSVTWQPGIGRSFQCSSNIMHMVYPFQPSNVIVQITTEKHHRTKTKEKEIITTSPSFRTAHSHNKLKSTFYRMAIMWSPIRWRNLHARVTAVGEFSSFHKHGSSMKI